MGEDKRYTTPKAIIIIAVIIATIFIAAVVWFAATLNPGESVLVICVILFVYFGFRFLFG